MQLSRSIVRTAFIGPIVAMGAAGAGQPAFADESARGGHEDPAGRAMAAFREQARTLAAARPRGDALDTTPPVLHAIQVSGQVDAQAVHQYLGVRLDLTDDLSGIQRYAITFRSPSGRQAILRIVEPAMPAKKVNGTITIGSLQFSEFPLTEYAEPGNWKADLFYAYDANGNFAGYSGVELQRLGTTGFTVVNDRYDIQPPALVGGTIATPTIRLSKPPKGTPPGTLPYAGARIRMTDSGNGIVSGAYSARMIFCAEGCAHSFSISGTVSQTGLDAATVTIGAELGAHQRPGSYEPFALILDDVAGNEKEYDSVAFGGDTDFGDYFPDGDTVVIEK